MIAGTSLVYKSELGRPLRLPSMFIKLETKLRLHT
jgi:hypothetical protein